MLRSCLHSSLSILPIKSILHWILFQKKHKPKVSPTVQSPSAQTASREHEAGQIGYTGKKTTEKAGHNWPEKNTGIVSQQFTVVCIHYCLCSQRKTSLFSSQDHFMQKNKIFACQDHSLPQDSRYINPENSIWCWVQPLAMLTMLAQIVTNTCKIKQKHSSKKQGRKLIQPGLICRSGRLSPSPQAARTWHEQGSNPKEQRTKIMLENKQRGTGSLPACYQTQKVTSGHVGRCCLRNSNCQFVHPPTLILSCLPTTTPD